MVSGGIMKITNFWFVAVSLLGFSAFATSSFTAPEYHHIRQEGRVHVSCDDGFSHNFNSFWCEGSYMSPSSAAYFKTSKPAGFHHVKLRVANADGTFEDQWRLNPLTGKTYLPISLWVGSGLLEVGQNLIHYSVENKQNNLIEEGEFATTVVQPPVRQCRPIYVNSSNTFDCNSPSYACRELDFQRVECSR
jgi:hypothetical protein